MQQQESDQPKSIHIDIVWTFGGNPPEGTYSLTLAGQNFAGPLNAGQIRIDRQLAHLTGSGELRITVTNKKGEKVVIDL